MSSLTESPAWRALADRARAAEDLTLAGLFAADPGRAARCRLAAAGITLDWSRQRLDETTMRELLALAAARRTSEWIERMFAGEPINHTEDRAALHVALRAAPDDGFRVDGEDVMHGVREVRARIDRYARDVRSGRLCGATGRAIRDVVNIGIGGSDLGPRMVCRALWREGDGPRPHFVSNVDPDALADVLSRVDAETTLFVIASKTFSTAETMANAHAARRWLAGCLGEAAVGQHFVAVSTDAERTARFGIDPAQVFGFWDWVGGRYSLWSSVGLPIALCCGPEVFANLLAGARAMDVHFRTAPPEINLPLRLALIALWNSNFLGAASQVVAAYADRMEHFVPWLQQLEMESNGKGVDRDGRAVDYRTTPPLWGGVGTNAQHAFFQMLHQGPQPQPIDFVLVASGSHDPARQKMLLANGIAQASALAFGKDEATVTAELAAGGLNGAALQAAVPHRVFPGNRPSNLLLLPRLDAHHLGALLALYEHRSFMLGVLWNVNSFDQWGVELGKQLAGEVLTALEGGEAAGLDAAAAATVRDLCQ